MIVSISHSGSMHLWNLGLGSAVPQMKIKGGEHLRLAYKKRFGSQKNWTTTGHVASSCEAGNCVSPVPYNLTRKLNNYSEMSMKRSDRPRSQMQIFL